MKHNYEAIVAEALTMPGKMNECYRLFHNYSVGNQMLAATQLSQLEPINTFNGWKKLGRFVKKGEKAIALLMPVITKDDEGNVDKVFFMAKKNWFGLSQTDGAEYIAEPMPEFNIDKALSELSITRESFNLVSGNVQGYAKPSQKVIAINPLASDAFKTTVHEMAHCLLHDSESMHDEGLPSDVKEVEAELTAYLVKSILGITKGLEYSRGYIQSWLADTTKEQVRFAKVFGAVDKILKAGK